MKKILSLTLLLAAGIGFTACVNEEDDLFDKTAAERLNEASALYSSRLMAQPNGWAMQLYPTNDNEAPYGSGYLVLCRFNKDHSVVVSMKNQFTDNVYRTDTSLWEVITDNGPVLSFNSHNDCLHAFTDPEDILWTGNADEPNNETGTGVGGDYEFIIVDAPEDASYMMLKGKKRGTYTLFTPVEEGVEYESYLADVENFMKTMFPSSNPTFDVLHTPNGDFKMTGIDDGIPNIFPYDGDEIIDESFNAFLITKRGDDYYLRLRDSFRIESSEEEASEQEFMYHPDQDLFIGTGDDRFIIDGDEPNRFFRQALIDETRQWRWTAKSEMSAAYGDLMTKLSEAFKSKKLTYDRNILKYNTSKDKVVMTVSYKRNTSTISLDYIFGYSFDESNKLTLTYEGPNDKAAETMLTQIPEIKGIVDAMNGQLNVKPSSTRFNLNNLRIETKDSNLWFDIVK
jgi:hypothetical protein